MHTPFSSAYLHIHLHEGIWPALETHWLGFATSAEFHAAVEQALQMGRQAQVKGWIADDRLLGAVRPRDLQWIHEKILLSLNRAGLQRFALLESQDTMNRLTIASMYQQAASNIDFEIRRFEDIEQARAWACGQDE